MARDRPSDAELRADAEFREMCSALWSCSRPCGNEVGALANVLGLVIVNPADDVGGTGGERLGGTGVGHWHCHTEAFLSHRSHRGGDADVGAADSLQDRGARRIT